MKRFFLTLTHRATPTEDFTGEASGGVMTQPPEGQVDGIVATYSYAADNQGGLFDPLEPLSDQPPAVRMVERIALSMGGQSAWYVYLIGIDGEVAAVIASGTNQTGWIMPSSSRFALLPGEMIQVVTVDMTSAGTATVTFSVEP